MDIKLREASETDLPEILSLYSQLGEDDGTVLDPESARRIFARFRDYPDYRIHVAVLDGKVVGAFALLVMDNLGHMGASSAILEDVVVAENLRGMGIGKRMMEHANELCRAKGCYKMTFSSNGNRLAAHRFYESLGFERHGFSFFVRYG
ncbi:MAG: GNAT family N-acetyltransferase [Thermodesulfobacteriota bacterium]